VLTIAAELLAKDINKLEDYLSQGMSSRLVMGYTALPETIFVIIVSIVIIMT
jgi:hypothetical protein